MKRNEFKDTIDFYRTHENKRAYLISCFVRGLAKGINHWLDMVYTAIICGNLIIFTTQYLTHPDPVVQLLIRIFLNFLWSFLVGKITLIILGIPISIYREISYDRRRATASN